MRLFLGGWLMLAALSIQAAEPGTTKGPAKAAVDRAREQVKMLDDLYKTAVVYITDKYVHTESDIPAASAAIALFNVMDQKGWHRVRLLDVTGDPYAVKNVAEDDFEKKSVAKMKSGEAADEAIEEVDGKYYYRAMTPVPVVSQKCTMCHPHYEDVAKGAAIGALSYRLEIK